ncbi:MAG: HAMP domain-containing histidine kinase [Ferruginibacter sp.]|nr:HAMP domain-containing histidine kinase [Cytophagales bacterium]
MSKKKIRFIIGLMALALVGLVSFQMYWIKMAITVKNEQFGQSIHEALEAVAKGLEKQEILYLASQHIQAKQHRAKAQLTRSQLRALTKPRLAKQVENRQKGRYAYQGNQPQPYRTGTNSPTVWVESFESQTVSSLPARSEWRTVTTGSASEDGAGHEVLFFSGPSRFESFVWQSDLLFEQDLSASASDLLFGYGPRWDSARGEENTEFGFLYWGAPEVMNEPLAQPWRADSLVRAFNKQWRRLQVGQDLMTRRFLLQATGNHPQAIIRRSIPLPKPPEQTNFDQFYANLDTVEAIKTSLKQNFDVAEKRAEVMQNVFEDLVSTDRKINDRINARMLDSLLRKEIRNRGIGIPFEHGVRTPDTKGLLFASPGGTPERLRQSAFKVNLFSNDLNCAETYLMVNFPTQQQYIFQKLGFVFLSSAVLILVVISCFYAAITTILQQKKLSEVKNDFINNMTHEFKTPIATISLACEVLQDGTVSADPVRMNRYLGVIGDENKRLGSQVEKVLQTALLDKGNLKLKISRVDVHEVIDHVLQNIGVQIEQRHGRIRLDLRAENPTIEADEMHLTNIIHNLVDNANKYSPTEPEIGIQTRSVREGVYITVADKGVGMNKEALQRIFERFYRVPTGNVHNVKGFGLGLSYVKTILQLHRGSIRVESQPGKGSSFEVFLPHAQG